MATKNDTNTNETLSAKELAAEMNVNPKSLRRFMRSLTDDRAGRGGKYVISRDVAEQIKAKYAEGPARKTVEFVIAAD